MINPMISNTWLDSVMEYVNYNPSYLVEKLFWYTNWVNPDLLQYPNPFAPTTPPTPKNSIDLLSMLIGCVDSSRKYQSALLSVYKNDDLKYLDSNLFSIFEESDDIPGSNTDVLKYNAARDSSINTSRKTMDLLSLLDKELLFRNSNRILSFVSHFNGTLENVQKFSDELDEVRNQYVTGKFYQYIDENGIRIAIGGPGKNTYAGKFDFIIDLGGDDIYNIDRPPLTNEGTGGVLGGFSCIIDLAGNDYYTTSSDFALAGALFSSSFIFDKSGDDYYESTGAGNLGAAIGGLGLLYDEKGNDTYKGLSFSIGAGCFGVGLLVDREGNDFYIANSYSQGFGMTEGVGAIIDNKGNDSYLVDSRSLDIGRYNDHYVSMCQGYGLGLRPFYAGGIGLIIEGEGNDIYNTDIFGQGGAYWYSLG
ncbi:MAG TPA: hypothetical protein PKA39_13720, partial [Ignavibacteria bacterium]|nr:hypothetical protein [Ignavibacteria bacterium]